MSQFKMEMERLYGDINLTDELVDEDALILLDWGAAQLRRLHEETQDDVTFEEKSHQVRRAMKRINGYIAKRGGYDTDKAKTVLGRFTEGVSEIGYTVSEEAVAAYIAAQQHMDDSSALSALLALMEPDNKKTDFSDLQNFLGAEKHDQEE